MSKVKRADRYEAQLESAELRKLHDELLANRKTLQQICDGSPKWRAGPFRHKPPSLATLSNIRDRLLMEATLKENEATVATVLAEMEARNPELKEEDLDEAGQRILKILCLRKLDVTGWVALQRAEKGRLDAELNRERFEVETCELFIQWASDQRAAAVAASPLSNTEKIAKLRALMFQDLKA